MTPTDDRPLAVGDKLFSFCGGAFRENYGEKTVEGIGEDWVVVRNDEGRVEFAATDPDNLIEHRIG